MPCCGIVLMPRAVRNSIVSAAGDHPLALRPCTAPLRRVVDDGEQIAADAVHHRRDDTHHRVGGNRRIDGVPAARQHDRTRLRGERAFRGDDAARGRWPSSASASGRFECGRSRRSDLFSRLQSVRSSMSACYTARYLTFRSATVNAFCGASSPPTAQAIDASSCDEHRVCSRGCRDVHRYCGRNSAIDRRTSTVRWAPSVTADVQSQLERKYHLISPQRTEGRTFSYDLTDLSRDNIRTMVLDPAVEDTHYIHRTAYRIWRFAPRSTYPEPGTVWGPLFEATIVGLLLIAAIAFTFAVAEQLLPQRIVERLPLRDAFLHPREAAGALLRAIGSRIPSGSPEQVAVFRVVFGFALLALFLAQRVGPVSVLEGTNALTPLHRWLLAPFARAPQITLWVLPWLLVWSALFIAGATSRLSYVMLTVGAFAWATLMTTRVGYHTVSVLLVALICLIPSRWSDAWSVDAWWRRRKGNTPVVRPNPKEYGYTIWMPGVVIGVIFAAAAVAKLRESGIAWILNGTVEVSLSQRRGRGTARLGTAGRPLSSYCGRALARCDSHRIDDRLRCFRAYDSYRAIAGAAAATLLGGFALFQGLFWPAWWLLLISFLPWHRVAPLRVPFVDPPARDRRWLALQPIIVIVFIAEQLLVSGLTLEGGPVFSTYGMYSNTYDSPAGYEAQSTTSYWLISSDGRQCNVNEQAARAVAGARNGAEDASARDAAQRCFGTSNVNGIVAEQRRRKIDWDQWRPSGETRLTMSGSAIWSTAH